MSECVVYWLFNEDCICPRLHGYVGISSRFVNRIKQHRANKLFPKFNDIILFKGSEQECFALEIALRPGHKIGWNNAKGGDNNGRTLGYKHSDETKAKLSVSLKGHVKSPEWRAALSNAGKGFVKSQASKDKQSASTRGVKKSAEHRANISAAKKRLYTNPLEREKMSKFVRAAFVGVDRSGRNNSHFGDKLSADQKKNISNGRTGKGLGNQNWRNRKPYSEEARRKMSEASKRRWFNTSTAKENMICP